MAPIQRATTIATDSLAKPTGVGQNVEGTFNVVSSIVDEVRVMDCEGCGEWSEPYVSANATAGARTDGTAATASDPTFRVASIRPNLVNVTSYVSKNIEKLTPVNYVAKVQEIALVALRAKVGRAHRQRGRQQLLWHQDRHQHQERGHLRHPDHGAGQLQEGGSLTKRPCGRSSCPTAAMRTWALPPAVSEQERPDRLRRRPGQ